VPAFERIADPNPNANAANAITRIFLPIICCPFLLVGGLNLIISAKLLKKIRSKKGKWEP